MTMSEISTAQKVTAEFTGTAFLLATVVGSGIMAENLAGGNVAVALMGNTIPTGAILYVLITMLGPVSGAHFNPAVTLVFRLKKEISGHLSLIYVLAQIAGGILGVFVAHLMFEVDMLQFSQKARTGSPQWFAEMVATFGLVVTILGTLKARTGAVPLAVGLYITAAYWFTASTSFANPAVTIARSLSNTFSGIAPAHVGAFVLAQLAGAVIAWLYCKWQFERKSESQGKHA
ncbi:MAG: aquaporin family protein [Rhizobiaceae bacterium]|nr:aquaporin family protein [Rhizobiaceae bacterium]